MSIIAATDTSSARFTRDQLTWLCYLLLAYLAYYQAILGPIMPFLRADMNLDYVQGSYHLSGLAIANALMGIIGDRVVRAFGRRRVLWVSSITVAIGMVLIIDGQQLAITLPGALLAGAGGALIQFTTQATLSVRHGANRARALTEINVGASLASTIAPLMVGLMERLGWGWRGSIYAMLVFYAGIIFFLRKTAVPDVQPTTDNPSANSSARSLPALFWIFVSAMAISGAAEWCVVLWSADYLESIVGFARVDASTLMTFLFAAMVFGRWVGSRLTHRFAPQRLMFATTGLALVGVLIFWLASVPALNVFGLFVTGLGLANAFPMGLATALNLGAHQPDKASARIGIFMGTGIFIVPLFLGWLADRITLHIAYGLAGLLFGLTLVVILFANRQMEQSTSAL